MRKRTEKPYRPSKKPYQIYWEEALREQFRALVHAYDPDLSVGYAILRLIRHAVAENWLPGYIKKERLITNKLATAMDDIGKEV